jgi:amidase
LLDVIAGPDPLEAGIAYRLELPPARHTALEDFRILVLDTHPLLPSAASIRAAIFNLAKGLAAAGARVAYESPLLPDLSDAARLYLRLLRAFLGFTVPPDIYDRFRSAAADLAPEDISAAAENLRGWAASHRDWLIDDARRGGLKAQWAAFFGAFDAMICPVMPTPAFPHDHSGRTEERRIAIDGVDHPYIDQLIWAGVATAPGLPATAIPLGLSPEGLPIGAQIVGPYLEDRTPLALAASIEREFGGFTPPPGYA